MLATTIRTLLSVTNASLRVAAERGLQIDFPPSFIPPSLADIVTPFDLQIRTRFVHAPNAVEQLGSLAAELGAKRVLLVTDPGIRAAGHAAAAIDSLRTAGLETELFDGVGENPTTDHVAAGLAVAERFRPELIVGFGGGSSMDCAKGINFPLYQRGQIRDYWGRNKAAKPLLPMIAVPTTSGTGSEAQSYRVDQRRRDAREDGVRR